MGMELVKEIDDLVKINYVFATATNKHGLVSNKDDDGNVIESLKELGEKGLLGILYEVNPDALVISTGGTAGLIENAGYKVQRISDFTGWPEMDTGLVKSMSPKLYVGMLAHPYTKSDAEYMKEQKFHSVDMVLANFYKFEDAVKNNDITVDPHNLELIRQNMDVGGPTAIHTARKGYLTTAAATRPEDYVRFANDLKKYDGHVSLESRFKAMQNTSEDLAQYFSEINKFNQSIDIKNVRAAYDTIHKVMK